MKIRKNYGDIQHIACPINRYIIFHRKRHPGEMSGKEVADFLTYLAMERKVSASTQNQALNALVFLHKDVLKRALEVFEFRPAKIGKRLPVVLSRENRNNFNVHSPLDRVDATG